MELTTKKVHITRDVLFVEDCFPFQEIGALTSPGTPLFTTHFTSLDDSLVDNEIVVILATQSPSSAEILTEIPVEKSASIPPVQSIAHIIPARTKSVPNKFQDYIGLPKNLNSSSSSTTLTTISSPYHNFSPAYQSFSANVSHVPESTSYYTACKHHVWCTAMAVELAPLEANNT